MRGCLAGRGAAVVTTGTGTTDFEVVHSRRFPFDLRVALSTLVTRQNMPDRLTGRCDPARLRMTTRTGFWRTPEDAACMTALTRRMDMPPLQDEPRLVVIETAGEFSLRSRCDQRPHKHQQH